MYNLFSKVTIEVNPPLGVKQVKEEIKKDKDGNLLAVTPKWVHKKGENRKSVSLKAGKTTKVTEEQYNWPTIQQLISLGKVIEENAKLKADEEAVKKAKPQFGTEEEQKEKLIKKATDLGLKPRKNATIESLRLMIKNRKSDDVVEETSEDTSQEEITE